jgi:hypothetical protein
MLSLKALSWCETIACSSYEVGSRAMARPLCEGEERGDGFSIGELSSVLGGVELEDQTGIAMQNVADLRWEANGSLRSSHPEASGRGAEELRKLGWNRPEVD